jgi:hypothetical protein
MWWALIPRARLMTWANPLEEKHIEGRNHVTFAHQEIPSTLMGLWLAQGEFVK